MQALHDLKQMRRTNVGRTNHGARQTGLASPVNRNCRRSLTRIAGTGGQANPSSARGQRSAPQFNGMRLSLGDQTRGPDCRPGAVGPASGTGGTTVPVPTRSGMAAHEHPQELRLLPPGLLRDQGCLKLSRKPATYLAGFVICSTAEGSTCHSGPRRDERCTSSVWIPTGSHRKNREVTAAPHASGNWLPRRPICTSVSDFGGDHGPQPGNDPLHAEAV